MTYSRNFSEKVNQHDQSIITVKINQVQGLQVDGSTFLEIENRKSINLIELKNRESPNLDSFRILRMEQRVYVSKIRQVSAVSDGPWPSRNGNLCDACSLRSTGLIPGGGTIVFVYEASVSSMITVRDAPYPL